MNHLLRHFKECYRPQNRIISAAGNLKHREFVNSFGVAFRSLERGRPNGKLSPPRATPTIAKREKKSLEQLHLCLGLPAFSTTSSKRFTLLVLNTLLGGTMSSRLWQRIREGSGLAYSVYSGSNSFHDAGFLMIYAATNPATRTAPRITSTGVTCSGSTRRTRNGAASRPSRNTCPTS